MNATASTTRVPAEGFDRSLWLSVLGAPFLYLCHHELNYALVEWSCASGKHWILTAISALFLALLLGSAGVAWLDFQRSPAPPDDAAPDVPLNRHRLLASLGLMSAGLFFLLVLAQGIATVILDPCKA
jgi:hypothetical protein